MLFFIFLSCYWAFISNTILEGERSSNRTSTPSWLIFVCPPLIPPPHSSPSPPQFAANHTQQHRNKPLPSLEGCGLKSRHSSSFTHADPSSFSFFSSFVRAGPRGIPWGAGAPTMMWKQAGKPIENQYSLESTMRSDKGLPLPLPPSTMGDGNTRGDPGSGIPS